MNTRMEFDVNIKSLEIIYIRKRFVGKRQWEERGHLDVLYVRLK